MFVFYGVCIIAAHFVFNQPEWDWCLQQLYNRYNGLVKVQSSVPDWTEAAVEVPPWRPESPIKPTGSDNSAAGFSKRVRRCNSLLDGFTACLEEIKRVQEARNHQHFCLLASSPSHGFKPLNHEERFSLQTAASRPTGGWNRAALTGHYGSDSSTSETRQRRKNKTQRKRRIALKRRNERKAAMKVNNGLRRTNWRQLETQRFTEGEMKSRTSRSQFQVIPGFKRVTAFCFSCRKETLAA